jgi:hypothetical protein
MIESNGSRAKRHVAETALERGFRLHFDATEILEPHVCNALSVSRQVLELVQAIEVIDWYMCYGPGLSEAQIDRNASFPLRRSLLTTPERYTAAFGTEVKLDALSSDVGLGRPGDLDAYALKVVDPEHPISSADGAVACGGTFREDRVSPVPRHRATVTRTMKHSVLLSVSTFVCFSLPGGGAREGACAAYRAN